MRVQYMGMPLLPLLLLLTMLLLLPSLCSPAGKDLYLHIPGVKLHPHISTSLFLSFLHHIFLLISFPLHLLILLIAGPSPRKTLSPSSPNPAPSRTFS